jgi:UV DNA damage endonuclease
MQRRAHAGRCPTLPAALEVEGAGWWIAEDGSKRFVDLMVEAKDKEQAVFELYRTYGLADVVWENLRPAKPDPGFVDEDDGEGKGKGPAPKKSRRKKGTRRSYAVLRCGLTGK